MDKMAGDELPVFVQEEEQDKRADVCHGANISRLVGTCLGQLLTIDGRGAAALFDM